MHDMSDYWTLVKISVLAYKGLCLDFKQPLKTKNWKN